MKKSSLKRSDRKVKRLPDPSPIDQAINPSAPINQAINSSSNLKDFLSLTLTRCMATLESRSGSIFLLEDESRELVLEIACWPGRKTIEGITQRLGEGISGVVASSKEPLLVKDINRHSRFKQRFTHYRTDSFISCPLVSEDGVIGVLNITERISGEPYTSDELRFISNVATYLAIAIEKIKCYEELRRSNLNLSKRLKVMESQLKRSSQENMDLKKEIELSKKLASIGRVACGIVHELNNPLDGVIRYTNLSLKFAAEDGIVREYLLEAKRGLNRMAKIIRSLLDFAREPSPALELVDINRVLDDSLFMMSHYIISNNIEVVKKFSKKLPLVQDHGLKLVFANLLRNACEAMPKGGTIRVQTAIKDGFIEVKFQDTGPGIPEGVRGRIFEPFFTTKGVDKGAGLGLAICWDVIGRYGGKISVETRVGEGSTFTVQLPLNRSNRKP